MKRLSILRTMSLIAILGIWACGSNKKATVFKPAQPSHPVATASKSGDVDQVITQARQHYFLGERELNLGHLEKAKEEFDASLDVLMNYQGSHEPNPKIESVIGELEDKIFQYEMAALKAGDGFTESPLEPALIDDLKNIDTFPSPDQQTKKEVENELATTNYDIPVEVNDSVLSFIRIFQNSRRNEFVGGLVRSGRYLDLMKKIFREEGVPQDLVYTALIESSFKPNAYSHARAKGFWQFISGTADRYDLRMDWWVDERSDFEKSTRAAARYLRDLHDMFGDWYLALAGYNAGENKIAYGIRYTGARTFWELARTHYIRQETKNYVPAILAGMIISKDPKKYGFEEEPESPITFDAVTVDYTVDLRLVAECTGASLEEIKMLNPELTRLTTPSRDQQYSIRVPAKTKDVFLSEIAAVPADKRITWRKHEVKPGETLTSIAAIYRTSSASIAAVNSMNGDSTVPAGSRLVIPIGRAPEVTYSSKRYSPPTSGTRKYYVVKRGDTLRHIATAFGSTVQQICLWNGFSSGHVLRAGETIIVRVSKTMASNPSTSKSKKIVYRVKQGDTLFRIASNYNIDVDSIKRWNKSAGIGIFPGDQLTLYTK
jgi:membrane-bound lytic murein transglycosylase D